MSRTETVEVSNKLIRANVKIGTEAFVSVSVSVWREMLPLV